LGKTSVQEVDACAITQSVTKANFMVTSSAEVGPTIRKAFRLAATGRPGPVLVDLPRDVQVARGAFLYPAAGADPRQRLGGVPRQLARAAALLRQARQPLVLAGGGVAQAGASEELRLLAEELGVPVVTTLMGLGGFPGSHPLFFGMLGMHGRAAANRALTQCDLLLALGTRLGDRTTGQACAFAAQAKVVHVDVDPGELGKNVRVDVPVVGDLGAVLPWLRQEQPRGDYTAWLEQLRGWRQQETGRAPTSTTTGLRPQAVIRALDRATGGRAVVVTDVGQHQLWAAQHYTYDEPRSYLSSGGLGTMGFGLPAALGAKLGRPDKQVWCVCGDGGLQMNSQELATLAQEGTEVKVMLLNNGYLGMVRQWQELFYKRRYSSTTLAGPDFVRLAEAYGLPARRVSTEAEVAPALRWASTTPGPVLLEFVIEPEENVYPMVPPGATLDQVLEG
ncbi:MAG: thiamine pyrophosphate-dependent enzyme, partial [Chloroflexota bacterium]